MRHNANANYLKYRQRIQKEVKKGFFIGIPIVTLFSILFFLGAKSDAHFVLGVCLNLVMIFFLIQFIAGTCQKLSRTIIKIEINEEDLKFIICSALTNKNKEYIMHKNKIHSRLKEFNIYGEHKIGWSIKTGKIDLVLFKSFFDEEVLHELNLNK